MNTGEKRACSSRPLGKHSSCEMLLPLSVGVSQELTAADAFCVNDCIRRCNLSPFASVARDRWIWLYHTMDACCCQSWQTAKQSDSVASSDLQLFESSH